ncbi:MAG: hypothetical protein ACXABY_13670 [Candidatus Thorarchaeota archaeon]
MATNKRFYHNAKLEEEKQEIQNVYYKLMFQVKPIYPSMEQRLTTKKNSISQITQ